MFTHALLFRSAVMTFKPVTLNLSQERRKHQQSDIQITSSCSRHRQNLTVMALPLNPARLRVFTRKSEHDVLHEKDNICGIHLLAARRFFAKENVSEGVCRLIDTFPSFEAHLCYGQETACEGEQKAGKWQISFQVCHCPPYS